MFCWKVPCRCDLRGYRSDLRGLSLAYFSWWFFVCFSVYHFFLIYSHAFLFIYFFAVGSGFLMSCCNNISICLFVCFLNFLVGHKACGGEDNNASRFLFRLFFVGKQPCLELNDLQLFFKQCFVKFQDMINWLQQFPPSSHGILLAEFKEGWRYSASHRCLGINRTLKDKSIMKLTSNHFSTTRDKLTVSLYIHFLQDKASIG